MIADDRDRQGGLGLGDIARFAAGLGFEPADEEREGRGAQHAVGVDRDDPVGQRREGTDVLAGDGVGGMAVLAVARLVEAPDERRLAHGLAEPLQSSPAGRFHRPLGIGQEVVEGLGIGMDGVAQPRQRRAPRLRQQPQGDGGELLKVPHVVQQVTLPQVTLPQVTLPQVTLPQVTLPQVTLPQVTLPQVTLPQVTLPQVTLPQVTLPQVTLPQVTLPRALLVEEGHRRGGRARLAHGRASSPAG